METAHSLATLSGVGSRDRSLVPMLVLGLTLKALGVVFGDIGTSPLYAVNEIFFKEVDGAHTLRFAVNSIRVLGALGLIIWFGLMPLITIKYTFFVLRADNGGEGGVFAQLGLLGGKKFFGIGVVSTMLILSAGLLYGDGFITPAISILGAVAGLEAPFPWIAPYIRYIALGLLTLLFAIQYKGTAKIGNVFGPCIHTWFIAIAVLGIAQIALNPEILLALSPMGAVYAVRFMGDIGIGNSMDVLGSVMLVATGGEAMYADLGHFGRKPIQFGWLAVALPCLLLNYLGQGAYLLSGAPVENGNIFYSMVPGGIAYAGMLAIATIATLIASQALITGVYSLTAQAIAMALIPRSRIEHKNADHEGQIYMPGVNWVLYAGCAALILMFGSASKLAHAYGFAVSGVMLSTSIAMIFIARTLWQWRTWTALSVFGSFAAIESMFFIANSAKFIHGGYLPLLIGGFLFLLMTTWRWGRNLMNGAYSAYTERKRMQWVVELKDRLATHGHVISDSGRRLVESDRTAIFMISRPVTSREDGVPVTLRDYLKREGAIPEYVVLLHIKHERIARVQHERRYRAIDLGGNVHSVIAVFGFMEYPSVPTILSDLNGLQLVPDHDLRHSTIEIGQEELMVNRTASGWFKLRARAFRFLLRHATPAHHYYDLRGCPTLLTNTIPIHIDDTGAEIRLYDYDRARTSVAETRSA